MKISNYLKRLNLENEPLEATAKTLIKLQKAHYMTIPYENFDIITGTPLNLSTEYLYEKIITHQRGGYCFELNGLYAWLLSRLGFNYTERLARFWRGEVDIPMGRHRILIVPTENTTYICDVGIGCPTPTAPIEFVYNKIQNIDGTEYRIIRDDILKNILEYNHHGKWERYFSFGDEVSFPCDFNSPSTFCELSPVSIFNKSPMAHIFNKDGRISLEKDELKIFTGNTVDIKKICSASVFEQYLEKYFGISTVCDKSIECLFKSIHNAE